MADPSTHQTFSRHRDADDEAFGLPVPGDFASKACNRGANQKITEPACYPLEGRLRVPHALSM